MMKIILILMKTVFNEDVAIVCNIRENIRGASPR